MPQRLNLSDINLFIQVQELGVIVYQLTLSFLTWKAKKLGIDTKFIKLSGQINDQRPKLITNKLNRFLIKNKRYKNIKCLIVGVTYKKDCDDLRLSPALKIIDILDKSKKYKINILDDEISKKAKSNFNKINFISKKKNKQKKFE